MTDERVAEVKISISEHTVSYTSDLPPADIVFWLDTVKHMIIDNIVHQNQVPDPETVDPTPDNVETVSVPTVTNITPKSPLA